MEQTNRQVAEAFQKRLISAAQASPKTFFAPLPPETHYSGTGPVTVLSYLQCTNCTVVCDHIANKSSSFVLLNASILRKYRGKPSCDLQVFSNLSSYNYHILVKKMLLEIGFIENSFNCSNWPATSHIIRSILV